MKKCLFSLLVLLLCNNPMFAKPLDLSFLSGLKVGISKQSALDILKKDSIIFVEKNNDVGGKYTFCKTNYKLNGLILNDMRLAFKKGKLSILAFPLNYKQLSEIEGYFDIEANCKLVGEDSTTAYYAFDNCLIFINFDSEYIEIRTPKSICKKE